MKKTIHLAILILVIFTSGCKKDAVDLTKSIVGHYINTSENLDIVVNKIDNTHISIAVDADYVDLIFASTVMNSETAFTLNSFTAVNQNTTCNDTEVYTGSGSASANNITLALSVDASGSGSYPCHDRTDIFSASK